MQVKGAVRWGRGREGEGGTVGTVSWHHNVAYVEETRRGGGGGGGGGGGRLSAVGILSFPPAFFLNSNH